MSSKKTTILISILIVVLLGVSTYIAWQDKNARRAGRPAPAPNMTEEDILRSLAPLTARELSVEEMTKEKEVLKQLGAQTSKLSPSDAEKEKEILRSLKPGN
ncbi:MAG: hypothetical protein AAB885_02555 [Patescibacteria group bacterium]